MLYAILSCAISPIFVSQLLNNISAGKATFSNSIFLLVAYSVVLILGDVIMMRLSIAFAYIAEVRMQAAVAEKVMLHMTMLSLGYHKNHMSGGIVSDSTKLNSSIERFWDTLSFTAVPIATTIVSVCIALCFIFWQFAIILFVLSLAIAFVIIKSQNRIAPFSKQVAIKSSSMTAYLSDVISNITAVKSFSKEKFEIKSYQKRINVWKKAEFKEMKGVLKLTGSFSLLMTLMNICAFAAAIVATQYHLATIGTIYLVISYTLNVVEELWSVSGATRSYIRTIGDASPMIKTLDDDIQPRNPMKPIKNSLNLGKIEFKNVNFTHEDNKEKLFDNFNLTIKPGEKVGLVGKSGSGKTSLISLLMRFSDVNSGSINIDGVDIRKMTQEDLHKLISYVPQEPILFHRSIAENIAYGNMNATRSQIVEAARKANALDFIEKMSDGLDTQVGERGTKISGGQRQRIAIARAILKDAPILVLDEATSALDSESERLIQESLKTLMLNKTSIVIAHRLSTVAEMDRIIVISDGEIVEDGPHSVLSKSNGIYATLWNRQSGNFILEK
jgi:ATP-binding cassette subfamily B protein